MTTGGGGAAPLTADLCARAIIAAAQAFGDDPVKVCTSHKTATVRRSLSAAAGGLCRGADLNMKRVCDVLGIRPMTVYTARSKKRADFQAAETAAMRAAEFALWRPEARESVAGGEAVETLAEPAPIAATAEPGPVAKPRTAGPISAPIAPARFDAPRPLAASDRPVGDLVLEALASGPKDSMNLASMIDHKEMAVVSALAQLKAQGRATDEEIQGGPRRWRWSLVA